MAKEVHSFVGEKLEKRDVWLDGKSNSFRIRPSIWKRFNELATEKQLSQKDAAAEARRDSNAPLGEAIEAWVLKHSEKVYSYEHRESWLHALVAAFKPVFAERGYPLTRPVRVSIGFTSKGGRGKALGECWASSASGDGVNEIFISPYVECPIKLANILVHELCHAVDDCKHGHKAPFKRIGAALDMEGKAAHMQGKERWEAWARPLIEACGPVPHAMLTRLEARKKQTTRMLKVECKCCGFVFRAANATIADAAVDGKLTCPSPACSEDIILDLDQGSEGEGGEE